MPLTDAGFEARLTEDILETIRADQRANISPDLDQSTTSPVGQINGIIAALAGELEQVAAAVYSAGYRHTAAGIALDRDLALIGAIRNDAIPSTVLLTLGNTTGAPATVNSGSLVAASGTLTRWTTTATVIVPAGGNITVLAESTVTGPTVANAGTIDLILTPVTGWTSVTNAADAVLGAVRESDASFRARGALEVATPSGSTTDAIRAAVAEVTGVEQVFVFENYAFATDASGLPGKSIEVVAVGGTDAAVAAAILSTKPAGIDTFGSGAGAVSVALTDSQGIGKTIEFSRPVVKDVKVNIVITTNEDYPTDGDAQIKTAIETSIDALPTGKNVIRARLFSAINEIDGVEDIVTLQLAFLADAFGIVNLVVANRELADTTVANITVASTPATDF